jgi:hypothetical protein
MNGRAAAEPVSAERAWWLRAALVLQAPASVFAALRDESPEDEDARSEPLVLIGLLAGTGAMLGTSVAGRLLDDPGGGLLVVAAWAMFAGALYGGVTVLAGGLLLRWAERRLGGRGSWRRARHVFGFALAPLALGLLVLWPVRLALYGEDNFKTGGSDTGTGGAVFEGIETAVVLWCLALLVLGIRTANGWSWRRTLVAAAVPALVPALAFARAYGAI